MAEQIKPLIFHSVGTKIAGPGSWRSLHDDDFAHFANTAFQFRHEMRWMRNKRSKSLWYEETLPSDTLFL